MGSSLGMRDLSLWHAGFLFSSFGVQDPGRAGSRARGFCSLWLASSVVEARELSSCGAWAQLPCGMWGLSPLTRDRTHVPAL